MKTRNDLINRAAQRLGVLGAGQSLSAEDAQIIGDQIEPVIEELSARRVVYIPDPDEIEDAYFNGLADCLAAAVAQDFALAGDALATATARASEAERKFRIIQFAGPIDRPVKTEYF